MSWVSNPTRDKLHDMKPIVACGRRSVYNACIGGVRAEVAKEFAPELAKAGFWRRIHLRIRMIREVERRMRKIAPPWGLYLSPPTKAANEDRKA